MNKGHAPAGSVAIVPPRIIDFVQSKGAISLAGLAPYLPIFSKTWFGFQITTNCHFGIVWELQASARASHTLPLLHSL
jgi:hypothetical protein